MATPQPHTPTPLSPIQFERGGMVKKRFRRSNLRSQDTENRPNDSTTSTTTSNTTKTDDAATKTHETAVDDWWVDKRDHFHHWLRCNPLRLGISADSVVFIKQQLQRGDEMKERRRTCWRHVVVELLSCGVPGLDDELLSVAEIPKAKYDDVDMASLLEAVPSLLQGAAPTTSISLEDLPVDIIKSELIRLGTERALLRKTLEERDAVTISATAKEAAAVEACDAAVGALSASKSQQSEQAARMLDLQQEIKMLKKTIAANKVAATKAAAAAPSQDKNIAGSGIAAVKALSASEGRRPSSADTLSASIDINAMTMLERQQHFTQLRTKRRDSALAKKMKEEDEEMKKIEEERKANQKQRMSKWDHVRSRIHDVVEVGNKKKTEVGTTGKSENGKTNSKSNNSLWTKVRTMKAEGKLKNKKKKTSRKDGKKNGAGGGGGGASSLLEMCNALLTKKSVTSKSADTLIPAANEKELLPLSTGAEPPPTPTSNHTPHQSLGGLQPPVVMAPSLSQEEVKKEEEKKEEEEVKTLPKDVFTSEGFFDNFGSNDLKGKHVIQDAMPFNIDTFYRKRDKNSGRDGISLLMARKEDDHAAEEAIAVFFDRTKFTEEDAAEWWLHNRIRFPYTKTM